MYIQASKQAKNLLYLHSDSNTKLFNQAFKCLLNNPELFLEKYNVSEEIGPRNITIKQYDYMHLIKNNM